MTLTNAGVLKYPLPFYSPRLMHKFTGMCIFIYSALVLSCDVSGIFSEQARTKTMVEEGVEVF